MVKKIPLKAARALGRLADRKLLGPVTRVQTEEKLVALTYDDGPHPEYTPALLDILQRYRARATFFVVGSTALTLEDIVFRIEAEGHELGNHSWDHTSLCLLGLRQKTRQIRLCDSSLKPYRTNFVRPPFGHLDAGTRLLLFCRGRVPVTWSLAARDWLDTSAEDMFAAMENKIKPGCIILMHDRLHCYDEPERAPRDKTLALTEKILCNFNSEFSFVTLSELFSAGKPVRQAWHIKVDREWLDGLETHVPDSLGCVKV